MVLSCVKIRGYRLQFGKKAVLLCLGKSYTASSPRIPQVLTEARVSGRSGAM